MRHPARMIRFSRCYRLTRLHCLALSYPELIRLLYIQFAMTHYIQAQGAQLMPTLSYQRLHTQQVLSEEELQNRVKRSAANTHDHEVLQSFLIFNKAILKTK